MRIKRTINLLLFTLTDNDKFIKNLGFQRMRTQRKTIPQALKKKVKLRDNFTCQYCDLELAKTKATIDHYIPHTVVREHKISNLKVACQCCNTKKANINPRNIFHIKRWFEFKKWANKRKLNLAKKLTSTEGYVIKEKIVRPITLNEVEKKCTSILSKARRLENSFIKGEISLKELLVKIEYLLSDQSKGIQRGFSLSTKTNKILKELFPDTHSQFKRLNGLEYPVKVKVVSMAVENELLAA